jgi:predicted nucleotidyltransferase
MQTKIDILKVIVGSQAHGLATKDSDFDYRGVFVVPTREILKIGGEDMHHTSWIEGKEDDTSWEIGKFLLMAVKCNPTVLETFLAPNANEGHLNDLELSWGEDLKRLFPYIWNSEGVMRHFIGYGLNQRKKFLEDKDKRAPKYAAAYLRVLYNAYQLLSTGTFSVSLKETPVYELCKKFKEGNYSRGEVIDATYYWETQVLDAHRHNPDKQTDLEPVNEFLLKVRREFWDGQRAQ